MGSKLFRQRRLGRLGLHRLPSRLEGTWFRAYFDDGFSRNRRGTRGYILTSSGLGKCGSHWWMRPMGMGTDGGGGFRRLSWSAKPTTTIGPHLDSSLPKRWGRSLACASPWAFCVCRQEMTTGGWATGCWRRELWHCDGQGQVQPDLAVPPPGQQWRPRCWRRQTCQDSLVYGLPEWPVSGSVWQVYCWWEHGKIQGSTWVLPKLPAKPTKWGVKVWVLAESDTGYLSKFQVYTGRAPGGQERGLTHQVVTDLVDHLYGQYTQVYFDNFYTSPDLLTYLHARQVYACGTVRANHKNLPTALLPKNVNLQWHEFKVAQKDELSFVVWQDTKPVCVLSNFHDCDGSRVSACTIGRWHSTGGSPRSRGRLPEVYEGGWPDGPDGRILHHSASVQEFVRRIFHYLMMASAYNVYVVARDTNPEMVATEWLNFQDFLEEIVLWLVGEVRSRRDPALNPRPAPCAGRHNIVKMNFGTVMAITASDKFNLIWRYLHLANNDTLGGEWDKLVKIRWFVDYFWLVPVSVWEVHCRLEFRQYLPAKPTKWGVKVWVLVESDTGYLSKFQVNTGRAPGGQEHRFTHQVVTNLVDHLYAQYTQVYFNNFYTMSDLLTYLHAWQVYACGNCPGQSQEPANCPAAQECHIAAPWIQGSSEGWTVLCCVAGPHILGSLIGPTTDLCWYYQKGVKVWWVSQLAWCWEECSYLWLWVLSAASYQEMVLTDLPQVSQNCGQFGAACEAFPRQVTFLLRLKVSMPGKRPTLRGQCCTTSLTTTVLDVTRTSPSFLLTGHTKCSCMNGVSDLWIDCTTR